MLSASTLTSDNLPWSFLYLPSYENRYPVVNVIVHVSPEGEVICMSAVSLRNVDPGFTTVNADGRPAVVTAVTLI